MYKVMIIEDEKDIRDELELLLRNEGYQVEVPDEFGDIGRRIDELGPDLVLLDIGLGSADGFALCMEIRKRSQIPIIFVTSRDSAIDELKALSLGGDDYITKPYNIPVLMARIKAVLRRENSTRQGEIVEVNGVRLDLMKGCIGYGGQICDLTKNEIKILACLMNHPGEIVSRADMIEYLWDNQIYIDDNTLSVNMTRLRSKLTGLGLSDYIRTKRGMGYKI